jgi:hypothetical protein
MRTTSITSKKKKRMRQPMPMKAAHYSTSAMHRNFNFFGANTRFSDASSQVGWVSSTKTETAT